MRSLYLILSILLITNLIALGQVPQTTSFQGVLADSEGAVVADGNHSLNFKLFDSNVDGTLLWQETQNVSTVGGIFNVILGKVIKLDLPFDKQYWLEISIDGGDPLLQRIGLTSSAYSLNTKSIPDNIVTAEKVADGNLVRSINTLRDSVTLAAGSNVIISKSNNTLTISAVGDGASDNLGDHTATQNINLNGNYLSGDGGNEGVFVQYSGKVGIGTNNPLATLSVGADGYNWHGIYASGHQAGIRAEATDSINTSYGGYFTAISSTGRGVCGWASNTGIVANYGGYFRADGVDGKGVFGWATNGGDRINYGGHFMSSGTKGIGVYGSAGSSSDEYKYGGYFLANGKYGQGVRGYAGGSDGVGVYGSTGGSDGVGVYGKSYTPGYGYAGYFEGNVHVVNMLSKGGGSFKIDHPLDPQNKNLYHSFVESPDMMNVYNGNIILNSNGEAVVKLQDWFEALNKDFRYQLTAIGSPGPNLYVAEEISNNQFKIAGGSSGMKVSWQITGIRQDAFANANRIPVEEMKKPEDKGKYFHPKAFGMPETMSVDYNEEFEQEKIRMEQQQEAERERMRVEEQQFEKQRNRMDN